jgi:eukaryotic-like serine/threonine-protein kinase
VTAATFGPYRVLRELGHGGMGTVVLAEDTRLGRHVALKTVSGTQAGTSGGRAQLLDEARAAAALTHPSIAAVHDVIEQDGEIAIVFELVEGETLSARLAKGPLAEDQALHIAVQIAEAMAVAHAHGVLHRDLKPSNVMLAPGGVVKILDFGIARFQPRGKTRSRDRAEGDRTDRDPVDRDDGAGRSKTAPPGPSRPETPDDGFQGTPGYVAPEQWAGKPVDERADLYALGVVLFEMLTSKRPFAERDPLTLAHASIDRMARRVSSLKPDVTPALDRLVSRLLATDPALRPPKARVVADELRSLLVPPPPPPVPWKRWAAVATVVLVALGGAAWWMTRPLVLDVTNPVIAVLPFSNDTGESANDYVAAGVADSLSTSLAALPTVTVLPRARVEEARARRKTPAEVAADLDATFAVDGKVAHVGEQLRLTIALLKPDGTTAWTEEVEGAAAGVFDMQARLATALGTALQVQLSPELRARLTTRPTTNDEALDAYWRGRALLERRDTPGNLQKSTVAFNEALRQDARFVKAHAALGEAYWRMYDSTRDQQWADRAVEASRNAVTVAPDDVAARLALGVTLTNTGRNAEAVQELQRTLATQPNDDEARRYLGRALNGLGRLDEAVGEWRRAIESRPNNWQVLSDMGLALFRAARYDEAIAAYQRLIDNRPDNVIGPQMMGTVMQVQGRLTDALRYYERAIAIAPAAQTYSNIGAIRHANGDYTMAVEAFRRAIALRANSAATHRNLGDSLLKLGRNAEAGDAYRRAAELADAARVVNPNDAQNLSSLALYLQKAGDADRAAAVVLQAIRLAPDSPEVLFRAAQVHALAGRRGDSLEALSRALTLGYSPADAAAADEFAGLASDPRFRALLTPSKPADVS